MNAGRPRARTPSAQRPPSNSYVMKLTVIIPVYNEKNTLQAVLERVCAVDIEKEIMVVDDCSNDGGVDFLASQPMPGVTLVRHDRNRGKGAAIRTGLQHATGDVVLIQDADLEYDPSEYPKLLAPILAGEARAVYGSRFRGRVEGMRFANWLVNKVLSLTTTVLFGRRITDEATCYKLIDRHLLESLTLKASRFDVCPEVTAKLLRRGHRILEVPITYRGRTNADGKKIRWYDAFHAWYTLVKYRVVA